VNEGNRVEVTAVIGFRYNGGTWEKGFSSFICESDADMLYDAGFVRFANPENAKPVPDDGVVIIRPRKGFLGPRDSN